MWLWCLWLRGLLIAAIRAGLDGSRLPLSLLLIRLGLCDCQELLAMLVESGWKSSVSGVEDKRDQRKRSTDNICWWVNSEAARNMFVFLIRKPTAV